MSASEDLSLNEDASEILETLEKVEGRLAELKEERHRLFQANRMLVELVEHLEDELEGFVDTESVGSLSVEGYEYSFKEGWRGGDEAHHSRLEISPDVDVDGIETQIGEVRKSLKRVEEYDQD